MGNFNKEQAMTFRLTSPYQPTGDQPEAIRQLTDGVLRGDRAQVLLGVTGSGKTFTMANVIQNVARPTLILSHNKTLAAQLYEEMQGFFPENAVEYYVSYYDYYQPEAYLPHTDTYIEKDLAINEEIDRMRLRAVSSLLSGRRDVVVVSSVSCIYGMGSPVALEQNIIELHQGQHIDRNVLLRKLVAALYTRNDLTLERGNFRVKGDTVDIYMAYNEVVLRVTFWDDEIDSIEELDPVTLQHKGRFAEYKLYPANLFMTTEEQTNLAIRQIQDDLMRQVDYFHEMGDDLKAQRIKERVEYGFRLPAAFDNRPLTFDEFQSMVHQTIYVSATPADFELQEAEGVVVEQVIRPTGLLDPEIEVRPTENQIDDLLEEIRQRTERHERVLVTTLTKRMAEELSEYLLSHDVQTAYIHSDVATLDRVQILSDLRAGKYDVLVGVNLLREGLDLPEVSLVAILDADKEGFLRSHRSLTQTAGRAARNLNGRVIMYADTITQSMQLTIDETNRRRAKQLSYNDEHHITPTQISKALRSGAMLQQDDSSDVKELKRAAMQAEGLDVAADPIVEHMTRPQIEKLIAETTRRMKEAAKKLDFLQAAQYRDEILRLQKEIEL